ncbi:ATP-binding cassette domain-containing protein [Kitasatospora atroaurantiaca]|uniref:Putative ABC transport system ATP-binding protein n=1 Tax=Kitasatospora atroaurantiaca TaxID=285545 RepID=A0A561EJ65_9ACTN|nr:ATP-binding cassette domain-containing protein [Kitasatospora atroaurantiaca]TWE15660.1 putative ABC transport system ATP-binding protein [Kitasatospora atroaurantiaca]
MTSLEVLVHCQDAARTFGQGAAAVVAVHGASCRVHAGDRIAITGPSGSGKSTLLHLMAGLEEPTSGRVAWPGLGGAGRDALAGQVGVVFQGPSLIPALDVTENAGLPLVLAGVPEAQAHRRALEALGLVDAADLADKLPEELSGGQAQRVAIARVLALGPRLVLADEPTGQLDRATGQHIVDVLLATVSEVGAALVLTTHDPAIAQRLDERWTMHEGRLLAAPTTDQHPPAAGQEET